MEKRTLLFIVISLFIIITWDYLFNPKKNIQNVSNTSYSNATSSKVSPKKDQEKYPLPVSNNTPATLTTIEINTTNFQGYLIKENGFFKRLLLNKFALDKNQQKKVDLLREGFVDIYDVIYINDKSYKVNFQDAKVIEKGNEKTVSLYGEVAGVKIEKSMSIIDNSYTGNILYKFSSSDASLTKISYGIVISQMFKGITPSEEGHPSPHFFANKSFESPSERQLKKNFKVANATYGGIAEKYFALFFIDPKESILAESLLKDERIETTMFLPSITIEGGREFSYELKFFAGPKDPEILKPLGYYLSAAVDYGFFHFIARPLLVILNFFYKFTKNYGVSIILLTILIKLAFFPLSHKSYKSMKALQKLQPKMEEIRKKYANDREALNREMMLLYKRHGVNPLSGCLPMIVQIPFFIALYQALMNAIELRQAPFIFWLNDLSAKDPYYVTPILMGATMLIQQILTPSSGDPTQKKMMYILPIVFTFMFLNFPSGLVLYWLVNNIFSIFQQLYTMKKQEA
ncbi:MAG: membrane protein insertase YidC [bacterium]